MDHDFDEKHAPKCDEDGELLPPGETVSVHSPTGSAGGFEPPHRHECRGTAISPPTTIGIMSGPNSFLN